MVARVRLPGAGRRGPAPLECVELPAGATSGPRRAGAGAWSRGRRTRRGGAMALIGELRRDLRGEVRDDAYSRHLFSTDASMYAIEPAAVVFPRAGDDVAAASALAGRHGVPVIARGAGTSLGGQAVGA